MKIGVTGTRSGCNHIQLSKLKIVLDYLKPKEFHHGDCVGVDVEAAQIAHDLGSKIICHPPEKDNLRGFFKHNYKVLDKKSYFARNRKIVDKTELLIVVPYQNEHQTNGGTWYTYDYARKKGRPTIVLYPDGRVIKETGIGK